MKVKVSYTVDFDEIPAIITNLLQKCRASLESSLGELKFVPHSPEKTMIALDALRSAMAAADSQLQDVTQLVAGWDSVVNSDPEIPPLVADEDINEED